MNRYLMALGFLLAGMGALQAADVLPATGPADEAAAFSIHDAGMVVAPVAW